MLGLAGAAVLLEEPPEIEFRAGMVYFTDRIGDQEICRVMRRDTAMRAFALFAKRLQENPFVTGEVIEVEFDTKFERVYRPPA